MAVPVKASTFLRDETPAVVHHSLPSAPSGRVQDGDIFHFVYLEQIAVIDGVCHKERLRTADDLVVGDEYRFPVEAEQARTRIVLEQDVASVRLLSDVDVGEAAFAATRTHSITLMSSLGQAIAGSVFLSTAGRVFISMPEMANSRLEYTLIAMSAASDT